MPRRFSAQHAKSGYSAMGGNLKRPTGNGAKSHKSIQEAIAAEAARARRMAAAGGKKKTK